MHLAIQPQRLHDFGAEGLERTAVVVEMDAGGPRDQAVGQKRRQAPVQPGVLPILSPAAHDVESLIEPRDHRRNVARIVLEVAVGCDDDAATGGGESGRKRGRLSEVAPELNHAHARVALVQGPQRVERAVGAAVVHENQLIGSAGGLERRGQFAMELFQIRGFIEDRDDDRDLRGHGGAHSTRSGSAATPGTRCPARGRRRPATATPQRDSP